MILLNPKQHTREYKDVESKELMIKTIEFFEKKGLEKLKKDYYAMEWYADFMEFLAAEKIFATMCTPAGYGAENSRWDTWRICEFAEILGFYGLQYWYTWQVSVLGLGPIWLGNNEMVKNDAAEKLRAGGIFAFGLSEKTHGADIYSTDMVLTPNDQGGWKANGSKYYIGNSNKAAITSTFGRIEGTDDYVWFAADPTRAEYRLVRNVVASQNYVGHYELNAYDVSEADILARGDDAWNTALNTVNIGKFNLGWASIGICTHAFYEAITHAANRTLYKMQVTDFPHVKQLFVDGYARLVAMKLFALRASDYARSASPEDRRYLLYTPMVKMKVTTQGEDVINCFWDVIAARGFERDTYFSQAAIDIRGLPKLEGTVHVNIALIVKFMPNFLFSPEVLPDIPKCDSPQNDDHLFNQGPTRGLSKIKFHDFNLAYDLFNTPNLEVFKEQLSQFRTLLTTASPSEAQMKDIDFLLTVGEMFAMVVYGQLILENAKIYALSEDLVDQMFEFFVKDFSKFALELYSKPSSTPEQMEYCQAMLRKPDHDECRYSRVWEEVLAYDGVYEMNP